MSENAKTPQLDEKVQKRQIKWQERVASLRSYTEPKK
jgi:hypothetical protein